MKSRLLTIIFIFLCTVLSAQVNVLYTEQLSYRDGLPHNSVQSIKQDKYGFMWFSSFAGLSRYDGYRFVEFLPEPDNERTIYTKSVYNMVLDSMQNLWIAFFDTTRFCMYDYATNDFIRVNSGDVPRYVKDLSNRKNVVMNVTERGNERWKLENDDLTCTNIATGEDKKYKMRFAGNESPNVHRVRAMYLDLCGILWIGTEDCGVIKVNTQVKPFNLVYYDDKGQSKLFSNLVRSIHEDKNNNLYIGTQSDGLYKLNRKTLKLTEVGSTTSPVGYRLRDSQIRCLFEDSRGHIWIGTKGGLGEYNPENGYIRNYNRFGDVNIPHNWVYSIVEDKKGNLWVGTFGGGLAYYDREKDKFIHIDPYKSLTNSRVYSVLIDRNDRLWVGTHGGGISCLTFSGSVENFEVENFLNEQQNPNSLSSNRVFTLYEDFDGNIWAATDYGLNRINPQTGEIRRFDHGDGMSDDIVYTVTQDAGGNIWISNQKGISRLDTKTFEFSNFNEKDGLYGSQMSENSVFNNKATGELIFGSSQGLVSFFPKSIEPNRTLPNVVLTRLEVLNQEVVPNVPINDKVIMTKHISQATDINLDYSHRSFTIEFAALLFSNSMSSKYQYMLENYDKDWVSTSASRRYATYSNLPSGKYTFRVRATNGDGIWNPEECTLRIRVRPPWWSSVWAFIAYVIIISLISYFSIIYLLSRMKMKNEVRYEKMKARKVEELNQMKEQFFTRISHELRTPLSLLLDPLRKLISKNVPDSELDYYYNTMYQSAQRLSKLVNELLCLKKIEAEEFSLKYEDAEFVSFVLSIANTFEISAADKGISISFASEQKELAAKFDKNAMEKIVFNLLSNALKYNKQGGAINIHISVLDKGSDDVPKTVVFEVVDTGIGISPESVDKIFEIYYREDKTSVSSHEGSGIGLSLCRELVLLHGGTIDVKSKLGEGSTFTVKLPIVETVTELAVGDSGRIDIYSGINKAVEPELVVEKDDAGEDEDDLEKEATDDAERPKIVVVEDNDDVRSYIKRDLEDSFDVIEAVDGADGWNKVIEQLPDLVVSDLMMPVMDGHQLCRRIKSEKQTSHIPVIVLTAQNSEKTVLEAIENGADAFVAKPFSSALLKARIKNLIVSRKELIESVGKSPFIDIKKMAGNTVDEEFLNSAVEYIEEFISEPEFNIDLLSDKMGMSRRHLSHKIKTLTGSTVNEFVKTVRLNKGVEMMLNTDYTISEIAYMLGYTAPANFSRSFSKHFGKTPTEYVAFITQTES